MMNANEATTDKGSVRMPATDRESAGDPTIGDTPSADRGSADDATASDATGGVTESKAGTSGGPGDDTSAPSGGDGTMTRATIVCPDESDFRVRMELGGGVKSVASDIVAEASTSGVSLKVNDKIRVTVSADTGKVDKIFQDK